MKEFSKFEIAVIKRTAQNVNPMVTKKNKIKAKIAELQEEYDKLNTMQEQYEASIKTMTGGYTTEDLVNKVIEDTGKTDKEGKPIKITKYVLKYPETVIPVGPQGCPDITACDNAEPIGECPSDAEPANLQPEEILPGEGEVEDSNDLPFMN